MTPATPAHAEALANKQVIELWPSVPPGTEASKATPTITERSKTLFQADRALTGIIAPSLTAIVPEHPNGTAMIVAPGGAYARVVLDKEGQEIVDWLRPLGITVFLMTYRLPAEGHADGKDVPLEDGQRAVRLIREHASEWNLDPQRIGFMGFSAAGHLGASLITGFDKKVYEPIDETDKVSARPDFAILGYPVVSMDADVTHLESRTNLIGKDPSPALIEEYSPDKHVTGDTPKTFIVLADDDPAVPPENSIRLFSALRKAGVAAEMHVFMEGGHGFGIVRAAGLPAGEYWPALCTAWMQRIGILK
ncbi:alpha/beta hydrolase [Consotaella salsifontis]|nr:alpha/beta hydrolase [Consotaella salsifontis]